MAQKVNHIEWKDEFSVNVELIDRQHKEFVSVLNELYESSMTPGKEKAIPNIFKRLDEYTNYHFATEEKYFDEFNYDGAVAHKQAHRDLILKLDEYKKRYENGEDIILELLDLIEDWLVNHLSYFDKQYTKCFNEHGLK